MSEAIEPNALYDVKDLTRLLKITPGAVRALIRNGILPASKIGRKYFVRRASLLALVPERKD